MKSVRARRWYTTAIVGVFGVASSLVVAAGVALAPPAGATAVLKLYDIPISAGGYPDGPHLAAINSAGVVAGGQGRFSSCCGGGQTGSAFTWSPTAGLSRLANPSGVVNSDASDLNDSGVVVGTVQTPDQYGTTFRSHGVRWVNGVGVVLPGLTTDKDDNAAAVNGGGIAVGTAESGTIDHAVEWTTDDVIHDIHPSSWFQSTALDINDAGQVVGSGNPTAGTSGAFFRDANGTTVTLPRLVATGYIAATSINTAGQVAGVALGSDGKMHAVRWTAGTHAINDLGAIDGSAGTAMLTVNDSGFVLGFELSGTERVLLWDPNNVRTVVAEGTTSTGIANVNHVLNNSGNFVVPLNSTNYLGTVDVSGFPILAAPATMGGDLDYPGFSDDPVNTATGNFHHTKVDVTYPSSVYGMDFAHTYNSFEAKASSNGLDLGWSTSLDLSVRPDPVSADLLYRGPTGRRVLLPSITPTSWQPPEGMVGATVVKNGDGTYAIQQPTGERWEFDTQGRIVRKCEGIADWATHAPGWCGTAGNGEYVTIAWAAVGNTRPSTVTSSNGMSQAFNYDANNQLQTIVAHDDGNAANDRTVTFNFASQRLAWVSATHLSSEASGYPVETYARDAQQRVSSIAATLMLGTGVPDTSPAVVVTIVSNVYNDNGAVTQQTSQNGAVSTFNWDYANRQVTITNSANSDTVRYTHDANNRLTTLADITNPAQPHAVSKSWNATDPTKSTDVTDRANAQYGYTYDSAGRLTQRAIPDPTTGTLPLRTGGAGSPFPDPPPGALWGLEKISYKSDVSPNDQRVELFTDAEGGVTKYEYDANSFIPKKTTVGYGSAQPLVTLTESSNNRVDATQDGDGVTTCNWYNAAGQATESLTLLVATNTAQTLTQNCAAHRNDWNNSATALNISRTSNTYTALGQLQTTTPPELQGTGGPIASTSYAYYGWGPQKSVTDALGKSKSFTYNAVGEVATSSDELLKVTSVVRSYNNAAIWCASAGSGCKIVQTTGPMNGQFISGTSGPKVDQVTTEFYDTAGNLRERRAPAAKQGDPKPTTTYTYGKLARLDTVTDPIGLVTKRLYDDNGNLTNSVSGTNVADADASQTVEYDKLGRAITKTSPKDDAGRVTTSLKYDRLGRTIEQKVAPGTADESKSTTAYLPNGLVDFTTTVRNDVPHPAGTLAKVTNTYTSGGRTQCVDTLIKEAVTPAAEVHAYQGSFYDDGGRLRLSTSPVGGAAPTPTSCLFNVDQVTNNGRTYFAPQTGTWAVTAHSYRRDGSLAGDQTPTQYALHHPASPWIAPDNAPLYQTSYFYDNKGRKNTTRVVSPADVTQTAMSLTCYTDRDEVAMTIDPAAGVTKYTYFDSPGVVKSVVDPTGMGYNAITPCATNPVAGGKRGQVDFAVDGRGNRLSRTVWNDTLTAQLSESWIYDNDDHVVSYVDQLSRPTTAAYTVANGMLTTQTTTTGDAADPAGASLRKTIETYFKSGAVNTSTANLYAADGVTVLSSYVTGVTYDGVGRRKTMVENPGASQKVTTFSYNAAGQVTQIALPDTKTIQAQWDLAGHQTNLVYPNGTQFRFNYDAGLHLSAAQVFAFGVWTSLASYTYNANGQLTAETAGANTRAWTVNDQSGAMTTFNQFVSSTTKKWDITYDAAGRVKTDCLYTSGSACAGTDVKTTYGYDKAGQLLTGAVANAANGSVASWTWVYGNRGNRASQAVVTQGGSTATTNYAWDNAAQLSSSTGADAATYTYDKAGRRVSVTRASGPSMATSYDARGKPSTITTTGTGNAITENRTYDVVGNVSTQTLAQSGSASHTATLWWDLTGRQGVPQVLEYAIDGSNHRLNYGNERISDTGVVFANDYLGSTLGTSGIQAPAGYDPFGKPNPAFGSYTNYDFLSYRGELTLGSLVDLRARDYDPVAGVFTTKDPLDGIAGKTTVANPYAYVYNMPLNGTDPTGQLCGDAACFGSGGGGGIGPMAAGVACPGGPGSLVGIGQMLGCGSTAPGLGPMGAGVACPGGTGSLVAIGQTLACGGTAPGLGPMGAGVACPGGTGSLVAIGQTLGCGSPTPGTPTPPVQPPVPVPTTTPTPKAAQPRAVYNKDWKSQWIMLSPGLTREVKDLSNNPTNALAVQALIMAACAVMEAATVGSTSEVCLILNVTISLHVWDLQRSSLKAVEWSGCVALHVNGYGSPDGVSFDPVLPSDRDCEAAAKGD